LCDIIDKTPFEFMLKGIFSVWSDKMYKNMFLDFCQVFFYASGTFFA